MGGLRPSVPWGARVGTAEPMTTAAARLLLHHQQNVTRYILNAPLLESIPLLATASKVVARSNRVARILVATETAQLLLIKYASVDGGPTQLKRAQ